MRFGGLIAAVMFAAIAAVIVLRMSGGETPAPQQTTQQPVTQQVKTVNILVAARAIPVGTVVTQEMIATQPWPEHMALTGFVRADDTTKTIVGLVSRAPFQQQEPIISSKLSSPSDPNFLAGELPKGMRILTILTNEIEGLAGFVFPGDHVDVILTHDVDKWVMDPVLNGAPKPPRREKVAVTETILTNVKVMAVDQRSSNAGATDKDGKFIIPRSVSLMVSQDDAQRLRLGQKLGTLTLALRALADRESADPLTLTARKDISQWPDKAGDFGGKGGSEGITVVRGTTSMEMSSDSASSNPTAQSATQPTPKR
jgi:pilus assembly protein CpaB